MKLRLKLAAIIASLMLPFTGVPIVVLAHAEESTTTTTTTETETEEETEKTPEEKAAAAAKLKERIEAHKAALKAKISAAEQVRIKARCKVAQGSIKSVEARFKVGFPKRTKAYENLQDHLTKLIAKLKERGVDTTTLEQQQATLKDMVEDFKAHIDDFKQEVSDLREMDCESDPEGFKAALEAARATHKSLVDEINAIKAYIKDTIRPTLAKLREEVKAKQESTDTTKPETSEGGQ